MGKQKIITIIGLVFIVMLVLWSPFKDEGGDFQKMLHLWGDRQHEYSDQVTEEAVSGLEGTVIGEHQVDGSNWSIPNIIRHLLGVD